MDRLRDTFPGWMLIFLVGFIGLIVNIAQMLGLTNLLVGYGRNILYLSILLMVLASAIELYRRTVWNSAVKLQRVNQAFNKFLHEHPGQPFDQQVDVAEIENICNSKRASKLKLSVKEYRQVNPQRIELVVDKGAKHGLEADMTLEIFEQHCDNSLCKVKLKRAGGLRDHPINEPLGKILTDSTIINFALDQNLNLSNNILTNDSFLVRLIVQRPSSDINALLGEIMFQLDN